MNEKYFKELSEKIISYENQLRSNDISEEEASNKIAEILSTVPKENFFDFMDFSDEYIQKYFDK